MILVGPLPAKSKTGFPIIYECFLFCDDPEGLGELHKLGEQLCGQFRDHPAMPHYALTSHQRIEAIIEGACPVDIEIETKCLIEWRRRRENG